MTLPVLKDLEFRTPEPKPEGLQGLGVTLAFNFQTGDLETVDGAVISLTGDAALRVWIEKALRTEREKYKVYPSGSQYGITLEPLIGSVLPRSFIQSELKRGVQEALLVHPNIAGISNFESEQDGSWLRISFLVVKADGTTAGMEVVI